MTDPVPSKDVSGPPFTVDRYGSFAEAVIAHRDWLSKEIDRLQSLLSAAYQLAGLVGAPVRFLDAFSRHEGSGDDLLPVTLEECDEIERLRTVLRGVQSCSTCSACRGAATMALGGDQHNPSPSIRALVESAYKDGYGGDLTDDRDLSARTLEMMRRMSGKPGAKCTCPAPGTSSSSWSPFCRVHSSPPPEADPADVIMSRGDGG